MFDLYVKDRSFTLNELVDSVISIQNANKKRTGQGTNKTIDFETFKGRLIYRTQGGARFGDYVTMGQLAAYGWAYRNNSDLLPVITMSDQDTYNLPDVLKRNSTSACIEAVRGKGGWALYLREQVRQLCGNGRGATEEECSAYLDRCNVGGEVADVLSGWRIHWPVKKIIENRETWVWPKKSSDLTDYESTLLEQYFVEPSLEIIQKAIKAYMASDTIDELAQVLTEEGVETADKKVKGGVRGISQQQVLQSQSNTDNDWLKVFTHPSFKDFNGGRKKK